MLLQGGPVKSPEAGFVDYPLGLADLLRPAGQQQFVVEDDRGVGQQLEGDLARLRPRKEERLPRENPGPPAEVSVAPVGQVEPDDMDDGPLRLPESPGDRGGGSGSSTTP